MEELLKPARIDEDVGDITDDTDYIVDEEDEYNDKYTMSETDRLLYLIETRYGA